MPVLKNIAAIAKGMSITFMEMFQPTIVENYPDGPGPLKGAKFQERYRGVHVLQRDENGLEKCVACFLCAALSLIHIFILGPIDSLDHASRLPNYGSKMGIDATRKWPSEGFTRPWPNEILMDSKTKSRVDSKWKALAKELGID